LSPLSKPGDGVCIHLYVSDVDTMFKRAIKAGAQETMPLQDMFWGAYFGSLKDKFGVHWMVNCTSKG